MSPSFSLFIFTFYFSLLWKNVKGDDFYNVTVDDRDPRIQFAGNWVESVYSELDEGGYHMIGQDSNATALFEFHGMT
jgi:hypothetical protein